MKKVNFKKVNSKKFNSWIEAAAHKNKMIKQGYTNAVVTGDIETGFNVSLNNRPKLSIGKLSSRLNATPDTMSPIKREKPVLTFQEQLRAIRLGAVQPEKPTKNQPNITIKKSRKIV